ncbi:MAG: hypothetical protein K2W92_01175 [Alphaproteobacteria bacterium]|nr:hypothetical protein [Alphaproteobacteria bacterium]
MIAFFMLLYHATCSPGVAMQVEEEFEQDVRKNLIPSLISSQCKLEEEEDHNKLENYIINLRAHNINIKKHIFAAEKKINLTLRPVDGVVSLLGENYASAFDMLPSLQNFSISLDLSHKELNLEELKSAVNLARNNIGFVQLFFKNLDYENYDQEKEHTQYLLKVFLSRNLLIRGIINDFNYSFLLINIPEEEKIIAEGLRNASSLERLNLCFNIEKGKGVIESIGQSKSIKSIKSISFSFFDEKLSSHDLNVLNSLLTAASALKYLQLDASLDEPLLYMLAENLRQEFTSLTHLSLAAIDWEESKQQLSEEALGNFFHALGVNKNLTLLQLDFLLPSTSIQALAEALKINKALKILALPNEDLGDEGVILLAEGLKKNASVIEIDFSNNNISNTGANSILDMLEVNLTLTTIHLAWNTISDYKKAEINKILAKRKTPVFNFSREISLP